MPTDFTARSATASTLFTDTTVSGTASSSMPAMQGSIHIWNRASPEPDHRNVSTAVRARRTPTSERHSVQIEVWADVRIASCAHGTDVWNALAQQERAKAAEYGHPLAPTGLLAMDHITPVVIERHGLIAPRARALCSWLYGHKARHLARAGVPWALAMHKAKQDLFVPLSLWLLKSDFWLWQAGTRGSLAD